MAAKSSTANAAETAAAAAETVTVYRKDQILKSKKYGKRRDLLGVLLKDEKEYTIEELEAILNNYEKGGVQ